MGDVTMPLTPDAAAILRAVLALAGWSLVMMLWMFATRLPAMQRLRLGPQAGAHTKDMATQLPSEVRRVSDNYNHLFEAPTIFYAAALAVVALGRSDLVHVACAWIYVALRIAHSLVQATVNVVMLRFTLFALSMVVLGIMIVRGLLESFVVF